MFCEQKSYRKDKSLVKVTTFEFYTTLEKRVAQKHDQEMQCKVGDFRKRIAFGARYHKACYSKYIVMEKSSADSEAGNLINHINKL